MSKSYKDKLKSEKNIKQVNKDKRKSNKQKLKRIVENNDEDNFDNLNISG